MFFIDLFINNQCIMKKKKNGVGITIMAAASGVSYSSSLENLQILLSTSLSLHMSIQKV